MSFATDVPGLHTVLGDCHWRAGDVPTSARCYKKAAQLHLQIHGGNTEHPDVREAMNQHRRVAAAVKEEAD